MPEPGSLVSEHLLKQIRETVAAEMRRHRAQTRPSVPESISVAPEVYVVNASSGIPALVENTGSADEDKPGHADCQVYNILDEAGTGTDTELAAIESFTLTVYNLSTIAIPADSWVLAVRDKSGRWIATFSFNPADDCLGPTFTRNVRETICGASGYWELWGHTEHVVCGITVSKTEDALIERYDCDPCGCGGTATSVSCCPTSHSTYFCVDFGGVVSNPAATPCCTNTSAFYNILLTWAGLSSECRWNSSSFDVGCGSNELFQVTMYVDLISQLVPTVYLKVEDLRYGSAAAVYTANYSGWDCQSALTLTKTGGIDTVCTNFPSTVTVVPGPCVGTSTSTGTGSGSTDTSCTLSGTPATLFATFGGSMAPIGTTACAWESFTNSYRSAVGIGLCSANDQVVVTVVDGILSVQLVDTVTGIIYVTMIGSVTTCSPFVASASGNLLAGACVPFFGPCTCSVVG